MYYVVSLIVVTIAFIIWWVVGHRVSYFSVPVIVFFMGGLIIC